MDNIRKEILELSDQSYREFQIKLLPDIENFAGVRLPLLRRLAKRIIKENNEAYLEQLLERNPKEELFEEIMLQGMIIGYMKADISDIFSYAEQFIPKINNWSVCDSFCSGFKHAKNYPYETWDWLQKYLKSDKEFEIRFGVVMLLNYYVEEEYLEKLFSIFDGIRYEAYYVKMAVAWAVSICYIKYPQLGMNYLENCGLDTFTYNRALQKITESHCVGKESKDIIKTMKRTGAELL